MDDLTNEISKHINIYKLKDWYDVENIDINLLCANDKAIHIIERYVQCIDINGLYALNKNKNKQILYDKKPAELKKKIIEYGFFEFEIDDINQIIEEYYVLNKKILDLNCLFWWQIIKNRFALPFLKKHILNYKYIRQDFHVLHHALNNNIERVYRHAHIVAYSSNDYNLLNNNIHSFGIKEWTYISMNCTQTEFLEDNLHLIDEYDCWKFLCLNENAIHLLESNIDKIDNDIAWNYLCRNRNAIHILENNIKNILRHDCLINLCMNERAIDIIKRFVDRLNDFCINRLCENNNFLDIIDCIQDKILLNDFQTLCAIEYDDDVKNQRLIQFLEKNIDKLDKRCIENLCFNKYALPIVQQKKHLLDSNYWKILCKNDDILEIDTITQNIFQKILLI